MSASPDDLAARRRRASSDDGLIEVTVDGTGLVVDIALEPKAMRLASTDLADALAATVRNAQQQARAEATAALTEASQALPDAAQLAQTAAQLNDLARNRLGAFSAVLDELVRRPDAKE
jgi:DNA-binding protein YbaB